MAVLAAGLLVTEHTSPRLLRPVHTAGLALAAPLHWTLALPGRGLRTGTAAFSSRRKIMQENQQLRVENLVTGGLLQTTAALRNENQELRRLLKARERLQDSLTVAKVISLSTAPSSHHLLLDQGAADGVRIGHAVLDAYGIMGQVIAVTPYTSRVLLITDGSHALPVQQMQRSGIRAVADGSGNPDQLQLRHITRTTDIRIGDVLLSSGLGQRFPAGYPVAEVTQVKDEPTAPFLTVHARPLARLWQSRLLLLASPTLPYDEAAP